MLAKRRVEEEVDVEVMLLGTDSIAEMNDLELSFVERRVVEEDDNDTGWFGLDFILCATRETGTRVFLPGGDGDGDVDETEISRYFFCATERGGEEDEVNGDAETCF